VYDAAHVEPLEVRLGPTRDRDLLAVARAVATPWADVEKATIRVVSGGITNLLFALSADRRPTVLVRVYGPATSAVIDRDAENTLFAELSRVGFAPPYHGRFRNGRVEGFLDGFRALEPHEIGLPDLRRLIARRLREMHGLLPVAVPSRLWSSLASWMDQARGLSFRGEAARRCAALDLDRQHGHLHALERRFRERLVPAASSAGAEAALQVVMAHNDLLAGNVLYDGREVRFIDYEYGAPSYAAFDLANHFCEYAGFDSDFEAHFPSRAVREEVVGAYLGPARAADVADFTDVVDFFVLPDHLWWGTWAVLQAFHSPIDFDFLGYAQLRFAGLSVHAGLSRW